MNNDRLKFRQILKCDKCGKTQYWKIDVSKLSAQWESFYHEKHRCCNCCLTGGTLSSVAIEQCTGERDKLGKLIFEGDIIDAGVYGHELIVRFEGGAFVAHYYGNNNFIFITDFPNVEDEIKIIGNIHEGLKMSEEIDMFEENERLSEATGRIEQVPVKFPNDSEEVNASKFVDVIEELKRMKED